MHASCARRGGGLLARSPAAWRRANIAVGMTRLSFMQMHDLVAGLSDEVEQGRAARSLLPGGAVGIGDEPKPRLRMLSISGEDGMEEETVLQVMQQDGVMRPATSIYEWLQQFCIEQCALLVQVAPCGGPLPACPR